MNLLLSEEQEDFLDKKRKKCKVKIWMTANKKECKETKEYFLRGKLKIAEEIYKKQPQSLTELFNKDYDPEEFCRITFLSKKWSKKLLQIKNQKQSINPEKKKEEKQEKDDRNEEEKTPKLAKKEDKEKNRKERCATKDREGNQNRRNCHFGRRKCRTARRKSRERKCANCRRENAKGRREKRRKEVKTSHPKEENEKRNKGKENAKGRRKCRTTRKQNARYNKKENRRYPNFQWTKK